MRLENTTGSASKFWEAEVKGSSTVVRYGKIGTTGQEKVKKFGSAAEAKAALEKLKADKLEHGYVVADGFDATPKHHSVEAAAIVPAAEVKQLEHQLGQVRKAFDTFAERVKAHVDPPASEPLGFLSTIGAAKKAEVAERHAGFEAQLKGPLKTFVAKKPAPTPADLDALRGLLAETAEWQQKLGLPALAFSKGSDPLIGLGDNTEFNLRKALEYALAAVPKPVDGKLSALSKGEFAKLSVDDQRNTFEHGEDLGYQLHGVSDAKARGRAVEVLGKSKTEELLSELRSRAEEDSDPYSGESKVEIGKPHITEVEALSNGSEDVAFKVTGFVNWTSDTGNDVDILGEWFVDANGKLFDEDYR